MQVGGEIVKKRKMRKKMKKKTPDEMIEELMEEKQPSVHTSIFSILWGIFISSIPIGIWYVPYRWRIISTGIWALGVALLLSFIDGEMKKQWEQKKSQKKE